MKIGRWSTTAASNNNTPPDGWPEGQAPSTVNDCAREMMASIRTMLNDMSFIDLAHTPTQTSSTTFTLPGNVVSFYDVGRRVKAFDGANTFYGTVISSSFTTNTGVTLRLDSGVLTTSLSSVATSVLGNNNQALPDSIARVNNVIINGQLDIWQEQVSFNVSGASTTVYIADTFMCTSNNSGSFKVTRGERSANASNVPTLAQCGVLLNHSIVVSVSAADAAVAAGDYLTISTAIQGSNYRQIAHKPNVVSFWANTNRTGTYCMSYRNAAGDRSYVKEFVISAANTWEQKTFLIPEAPTTGTWDYSIGVGVEVGIALAAGTTYQTTVDGAWTSMNALATSNQSNFMASAGHTIKFADFRLYEGTQILPVKFRTQHEELRLCQRYYCKSYNYTATVGTVNGTYGFGFNYGNSVAAGVIVGRINFPVQMKDVPTMLFYSSNSGNGTNLAYDGSGTDYTVGASVTDQNGFLPSNQSVASQLGMFFHWVATSRVR